MLIANPEDSVAKVDLKTAIKVKRVRYSGSLCTKLSISLREGLNEMAAEKGILISELVRRILTEAYEEYLKRKEHP
jgi:hypothetical protein